MPKKTPTTNLSKDMNRIETELIKELTDTQAAQLCGAIISTPEINKTFISPIKVSVVKPFYPALPNPKLARLRPLLRRRRDNATGGRVI